MIKQMTKSFLISCCIAEILMVLPGSATMAEGNSGNNSQLKTYQRYPNHGWNISSMITALKNELSIGTESEIELYGDTIAALGNRKETNISLEDFNRFEPKQKLAILSGMGSTEPTFNALRATDPKITGSMYDLFRSRVPREKNDPFASIYLQAIANYFLANGITHQSNGSKKIFGSSYTNYNDAVNNYYTKYKPKQSQSGRLRITDIVLGCFFWFDEFKPEVRESLAKAYHLAKDQGYIKLDKLTSLDPRAFAFVVTAAHGSPDGQQVFKKMSNDRRSELLDYLVKSSLKNEDLVLAADSLTEGVTADDLKKLLPKASLKKLEKNAQESLKSVSDKNIAPSTKLKVSSFLLRHLRGENDANLGTAFPRFQMTVLSMKKDIDPIDAITIAETYKSLPEEYKKHLNTSIKKLSDQSQSTLRKFGVPFDAMLEESIPPSPVKKKFESEQQQLRK